MQEMLKSAEETAEQLKLIANPNRLMVLCALIDGEKNVTELMQIANTSQTLMSNHLAILRHAGIIDYHRQHRTLNYYLKSEKTKALLTSLYEIYCQVPSTDD